MFIKLFAANDNSRRGGILGAHARVSAIRQRGGDRGVAAGPTGRQPALSAGGLRLFVEAGSAFAGWWQLCERFLVLTFMHVLRGLIKNYSRRVERH